MKALSFYQPRAEQVVRGDKRVDVRTWQVEYRGPLAVHASSERRDERCRALGMAPERLAYGAVIGTVELTAIEPLADAAAYEALRPQHLLDAPFPGAPCYAWHFEQPRRLDVPLPYRGRMRLFEVEIGASAHRRMGEPQTGQADPARPFVLYTIPEGSGYRVALYQQVAVAFPGADRLERAPGALWSIELGGDPLRAIADHLLAALRANGYKATELARAPVHTGVGSERPFYLDELSGLRLALIMMAVKPLARHERIEAIGQGVQAMGNEEAYYWFSKCSAGVDATRAQKALRVLLAAE